MPDRDIRWQVNLDDATARPFDNCWIVFTFRFNLIGLRLIRRIIADMNLRPDLRVDATFGRGLWNRNGRIRITGPYYAIRVAADDLARHLEN